MRRHKPACSSTEASKHLLRDEPIAAGNAGPSPENPADIDAEVLSKLYTMSLKSQLVLVRIAVLQNLIHDTIQLDNFKSTLLEIKASEKNETVVSLLNQI